MWDLTLIGLIAAFVYGVFFGAGFALGSKLMGKATS